MPNNKKMSEDLAQRIVDEHKECVEGHVVDILKLAQEYGFVVCNADLQDNEDGFVFVNDKAKSVLGYNTKRLIGVKSSHTYEMKRFVIAHELAHFFERHRDGREGEIIFAARDTHDEKASRNEAEQKIDFMAACLLMPKNQFSSLIKKVKSLTSDCNEQARIAAFLCKVPVKCAERRINEVC